MTIREYLGDEKIKQLEDMGFVPDLIGKMAKAQYIKDKNLKTNELINSGLDGKLVQDVMKGKLNEDEAWQIQRDSERAGGAGKRFFAGVGKALAETSNALYKGGELAYAALTPYEMQKDEKGDYIYKNPVTRAINITQKNYDRTERNWKKMHNDELNVAGGIGELAGGLIDPINFIPLASNAKWGKKLLYYAGTGMASGGLSAWGGDRNVGEGMLIGAGGGVVFGGAMELAIKGIRGLWSKTALGKQSGVDAGEQEGSEAIDALGGGHGEPRKRGFSGGGDEGALLSHHERDISEGEFSEAINMGNIPDEKSFINAKMKEATPEQKAQVYEDVMSGKDESIVPKEIYDEMREYKSYADTVKKVDELLAQEGKVSDEMFALAREHSSLRYNEAGAAAAKLLKNPNLSKQALKDAINTGFKPSKEEMELTHIINDGADVENRLSGYNILYAIEKSINTADMDAATFASRLKDSGFNDEATKAFTRAYEEKDVSIASGFIQEKLDKNVLKMVDEKFKGEPQAFKKEVRGIYNVTYNGKNSTYIKEDIENIDSAIRYASGNRSKGARHERIRHLSDPSKEGYVTDEELLNIGVNVRKFIDKYKEPYVNERGARLYEWEDKNGIRFRVVVENKAAGTSYTTELSQPAASNVAGTSQRPNYLNLQHINDIITFYSDRNLNERMEFENPKLKEVTTDETNIQNLKDERVSKSVSSLSDNAKRSSGGQRSNEEVSQQSRSDTSKHSKEDGLSKGDEKLEGSSTAKSDDEPNAKSSHQPLGEDEIKAKFKWLSDEYDIERFLKDREDISHKDIRSSQKLVNKSDVISSHTSSGREYNYVPPLYEKNYNADFTITKQDVKNIRSGKIDDELLNKLKSDLDSAQYQGYDYKLKDEEFRQNFKYLDWQSKPKGMSDKEFANAKHGLSKDDEILLFSNPHLGSGIVGGVLNSTDEEGNFSPENFAKGFLYGMLGSKGASIAFRKMTPRLYNKILGSADKLPNMAKHNPELLGKLYKEGKDVSLNSFAGQKAITANISKLDTAKAMAKDGVDEVKIWQSTGWFKDKDGVWKFEIGDNDAKLISKESGKLDEILDFNELYKAYPKLKDTNISFVNLEKGTSGYTKNDGSITINSSLDDASIKSTLLHEVQHKIQEIEGFSKGSNPAKFTDDALALYKNTHGEAEARNVQNRLNLDDEARAQTHPHETFDVDPNKTTMFKNGDVSLSRELERDFIDYKTGLVNEKALMRNAEPLPAKITNFKDWIAQFENKDGKSFVKTPIGDVMVNARNAFKHMTINTNLEYREDLSGAFIRVLQDPLFIVKQSYTPSKPTLAKDSKVHLSHPKSSKANVENLNDNIISQQYIYYKPFKSEDQKSHLAAFAFDKDGELINTTFFPLESMSKISKLIKGKDTDLLYYKNSKNYALSLEGIKEVHPNIEQELEDVIEQMSKQSYEKHDTIGEVLQSIESGNYETLAQNLKTNLTEGQLKVLKNDIKNAKLKHIGTDKFVFDKVSKDGDKKRIYISFDNETGSVRINAFSKNTIDEAIKQNENIIEKAFGGDEGLNKFSFETKAAYLNEPDPVKAEKILKKAEYARMKKEAAAEDRKQKLGEDKAKATAEASNAGLSAGEPRKWGFSDAVSHGLGSGDTGAMKRFLNFRKQNIDENGNIKTALDELPTMKELTGEIDGFFSKMADKIWDNVNIGVEFVAKELNQKVPKLARALDIKQNASAINSVLEGFRRESAAINANANTAAKYLKRFNTEQSEMIYNALDGKLDPLDLPENMQATYKQIRTAIDNNAKELVNAGALKEENVITDYIGHYYDEYMKEQRQKVSVAFDKFFKRKDLTDAQRKELGLRTDISFVVANTLAAQRTQLLKAKVLQNIADRFGVDEIPSDAAQGAWTRISDETAGGGIKKFGSLGGKYVPADIAEALKQGNIMARELGMLEKYWFPIIDHIKVNVTVKNPFTHVYNFASNVMLSYLHGDEGALLKFARLSKDERERYWKLGKKLGLGSALDDLEGVVKGLKSNEKEHIVTKVVKNLYMAEGSAVGDFARKAYAWEDEIFKISRFKKNLDLIATKKGFDGSDLSKFSQKELATAMKDAQYHYVDYSTPFNGRLQALDKLGIVPFLHYSIKSTPMVLKAIAKRPHRFLIAQLGLLGFGEMTGVGLSAFAGDNDKENLAKPDWAESGIISNLFGLKSWTQVGDSGWFINSGRLVPGFRFDGLDKPEFGFGFVGSAMKILGEGKSSLGYKLEGEDDTMSQRAYSRIKELLKSYAPPLTFGRYGQQLGEQTLSNVTGLDVAPKDYNQDELGYSGILGRGVGVRRFNKEKEYGKELKKVKKKYEGLVPVKVPDSKDKEKVQKAQKHNEKIAKMDTQLLREQKAQLEQKFSKIKSIAADDGVRLDVELLRQSKGGGMRFGGSEPKFVK